jgi:hypothetical protein
MTKNEKFDLAILLLLSILSSTYLYFRTYVISMDGAFQYIPLAKDLASGFFQKALNHNQQPLYSFIIALVSRWVPDFELAGELVSSFFGILIIFPVYFLGRRIFDERLAFLSSLLLAIHPYVRRFSADVLKESTYLFFLATALWFAWRTIQNEKRYPFLFIPLFSALVYLVRPDGVEILLVVFFYILFIKKFSVPWRKGTVILLLLLSSSILFLPYLIHLKETAGEWTLSRAKSLEWILGLEVIGYQVPLTQKILYSFKRLNLEILAIFHPLYLFLFILGLLKGIFSRLKTGEGFLLSFCALHYVVLLLMVLNTTEWGADKAVQADQLSGRHVLPVLLASIFWVGEGFFTINHWIDRKLESRHLFLRFEPKRKSILVMATLLIFVLLIILPKTLKPQRYERLPEKWAGIWIKNQSGKGAKINIFTTLPRVAYYADESFEYIDFKKVDIDKIKASTRENGTYYLVIRGREATDSPEKARSIKENFMEVMRYEGKGLEKIIIYKRVQ